MRGSVLIRSAMTKSKLLKLNGLSVAIGVPPRTIQTWIHSGKIPFLKIGHRTVLFDEEKVRAALERFEVRSVS